MDAGTDNVVWKQRKWRWLKATRVKKKRGLGGSY